MSKVITVFGATGQQGGSVVRELLKHPKLSSEYTIRAVTRDVNGAAAQALVKQGVEVKSADMGSKTSLQAVIKGSHAVFLVTTPDYTNPTADSETVNGRNVTDVSKEAGVQHLIFSSLVNVTKVTGGRLTNVPYFDKKAELEQYIRKSGVPSTFVLPGYFTTNYTTFGMIRKGEDGNYMLAYPVSSKAKFPLLDPATDTGKFVAAALVAYPRPTGKQIIAATDYYTPDRIVSEFTEVTGKTANFIPLDADTYKSFLPPAIAQATLENHLLIENPGYYSGVDVSLEESLDLVKKAGLKVTTWKDFLETNKAAFQ